MTCFEGAVCFLSFTIWFILKLGRVTALGLPTPRCLPLFWVVWQTIRDRGGGFGKLVRNTVCIISIQCTYFSLKLFMLCHLYKHQYTNTIGKADTSVANSSLLQTDCELSQIAMVISKKLFTNSIHAQISLDHYIIFGISKVHIIHVIHPTIQALEKWERMFKWQPSLTLVPHVS